MTKIKDFQDQRVLGWSERELHTHVINLASALGWWHYHTHDSRRSPGGFPDLVFVHPQWGRVLARELKAQRGRWRPRQQEWLEYMRAGGLDADVWRPADVVSGRVERELREKNVR